MKQGVIETYEENQLVVALPDLAVVRGALTDLPVGGHHVIPSPKLGLALLTLQDVASGAAKLPARDSGLRERVREAKRPAGSPKGIRPAWPAAFDEVIAVGARDGDKLAQFSPQTPWVDATAPGVNVESTYLIGQVKLGAPQRSREARFSNGFACWDGTSFAAAIVSGAVASKIQPGRYDARQALACICEEPGGEIRPFVKPDR